MEKVLKSLMAGAIDLHLHATFEGRPRRQNMLEVARDASAAGMRPGENGQNKPCFSIEFVGRP